MNLNFIDYGGKKGGDSLASKNEAIIYSGLWILTS